MLTDATFALGRAADLLFPDGSLNGGPVVVIPRRIVGGVGAALDGLAPAALPRLRFEGRVTDLRPKLRRAVAERLPRPRWLSNWLVDDVMDLASLMTALTAASALCVRLDVDDDDRRAFGVGDVRFRLVTTYRGACTEWVSPHATRSLEPGTPPPPAAVRRLARGEIAVLRGGRVTTPERPAVLHRAPSIDATGRVGLSLTIDDVGRILH